MRQELYHDIFGSVLDKREMTPYLLRNCGGYDTAVLRASRMMANRGFDLVDGEMPEREKDRAGEYARQAASYATGWLIPFLRGQLRSLASLDSPRRPLYEECSAALEAIAGELTDPVFMALAEEDPRHLFLLSSSRKYPDLFRGYRGAVAPALAEADVPSGRQRIACSILKMCHLIKSLEEDSQDIHDYARLGLFLESRGNGLDDLFAFDWTAPATIPEHESARRAFVKLAVFFGKLNESIAYDPGSGGLAFDSGDGVRVDIVEVKARLKSPESMFAKLGKDADEEAFNIRDILAVTFLLKRREDALTLFHALQKRGVILQENTVSPSITQTLFSDSRDMEEAVRHLMLNLAKSEGSIAVPTDGEVADNAREFFNSLTLNAGRNPHSADRHRKFQCKINFSLPLHRDAATRRILIPGTAEYAGRGGKGIETQQHTLPVELRISDIRSWEESEKTGDAHHDAYKCRQLLALMNRLFDPLFDFPPEAFEGLREDQGRLY